MPAETYPLYNRLLITIQWVFDRRYCDASELRRVIWLGRRDRELDVLTNRMNLLR